MEFALRNAVVVAGRRLESQGLITAAEGNVSVRLGGGSLLITPAGTRKGELRPPQLVVLDGAGRAAGGTPSSEWRLHRVVYDLRPEASAVCHAHAPWATAFAVAGRALDGTRLTETAAVLPKVPVTRRAEPGTADLAASVAELVPQYDAILLANHGVLTVGPDLETACRLLETVERLAQVTLLAAMAESLPPSGGGSQLPW
ncbi:MAG: class II aldolase/adducin family protein [bacterium]|nr:class II aldolase/adducin family protein [bacterium]